MIPIVLKGRRALITGGDSGLGAATGKSLAEAGADIAIAYRDGPEAADAVAATAKSFGNKVAIARVADIASAGGRKARRRSGWWETRSRRGA